MAKGSSRKLRKRLASANAVATAVIDEQARAAASSNLSNDDLFFVERGAAPRRAPSKRPREASSLAAGREATVKLYTRSPKTVHPGSRVERERVERIAARARPAPPTADPDAPRQLRDLWADDGAAPAKRRRVPAVGAAAPVPRFATTIAPSGFSVNPEHDAHQDALAAAVAAERAADAEAARLAAALAPTAHYAALLDAAEAGGDPTAAPAAVAAAGAAETEAEAEADVAANAEFARAVAVTLRGGGAEAGGGGSGTPAAVAGTSATVAAPAVAAAAPAARQLPRRQRPSAGAAARARARPAILPLLSDELTGSLGATPRIPAAAVAAATLADLVARGLAAPRTLTVQERRKHVGKGNVRGVEFPRPHRVAEIERARRGEA